MELLCDQPFKKKNKNKTTCKQVKKQYREE